TLPSPMTKLHTPVCQLPKRVQLLHFSVGDAAMTPPGPASRAQTACWSPLKTQLSLLVLPPLPIPSLVGVTCFSPAKKVLLVPSEILVRFVKLGSPGLATVTKAPVPLGERQSPPGRFVRSLVQTA